MHSITFVNGAYQLDVANVCSYLAATIKNHYGWSDTDGVDGLRAGLQFVTSLKPAQAILLIEAGFLSASCINLIEDVRHSFEARNARLILVMAATLEPAVARNHWLANAEHAPSLAEAIMHLASTTGKKVA